MNMYVYKVIREYVDGTRGKREKEYSSFNEDLKVGGLYVHLGSGYPGLQRVLNVKVKQIPD